jgi:predicted PurR-regulated permease PerM
MNLMSRFVTLILVAILCVFVLIFAGLWFGIYGAVVAVAIMWIVYFLIRTKIYPKYKKQEID